MRPNVQTFTGCARQPFAFAEAFLPAMRGRWIQDINSNERKFVKLSTILKMVTIITLLQLCAVIAKADQLDISNLTSANNITNTSTANAPLQLLSGKSYALSPSFYGGQAGTSNVIFACNLRVGTNWTTTYPVKWTNSANGTTRVGARYVIWWTNLIGANAIRFDWLETQQTNAITLESIQVDHD